MCSLCALPGKAVLEMTTYIGLSLYCVGQDVEPYSLTHSLKCFNACRESQKRTGPNWTKANGHLINVRLFVAGVLSRGFVVGGLSAVPQNRAKGYSRVVMHHVSRSLAFYLHVYSSVKTRRDRHASRTTPPPLERNWGR